MTRFMDLPTEFKFNSLHHSAKNSSIKKWNNKDGELAQLTELSLVLSDQCCVEIQNFTFIDLVLPYFMSQLYSWLNMSKCLSFKEWITTKLCWSAFQLVLQMLQNTACLVFNQSTKKGCCPSNCPLLHNMFQVYVSSAIYNHRGVVTCDSFATRYTKTFTLSLLWPFAWQSIKTFL